MGIIARLKRPISGALAGATGLSGGAALAQLINLVAGLVIARLYTPAELGLFSAVVSLAMIVSPVVTLGLQVVIVPARTDADALRLAQLGMVSTVIGACLSAIALAFAPLPSPNLSQHRGLVVLFVPAMLLALGTFAVLSQLSLRLKLYRAIAIRGVAQSAASSTVQVVGSLARPTALWLFVGELLGRTVGAVSLVPNAVRFSRRVGPPLPAWRQVLRQYADAIRYFLPSTTVEMAAGQVVTLFVAAWFGATQTGYLSMANRVLVLPVVLVGAALGQVLGAELAERRRNGQTSRSQVRFRQLVWGLAAVAILVSLTVFALGPWAFGVVFGEQWRPAGELARYLALPSAVGLVWNPISVTFSVYERLPAFLWLSILRLVLTVSAGVFLHAAGAGWIVVVVGMAIGTAVSQLVGLFAAWRIVHEDDANASSSLTASPPKASN